jgi:ABC-type phosphate transport system substrate-binding protein
MNSLKAILLGVLFALGAHGTQGAEIAIVVNKENAIDDLSMKDLKAIFEMTMQNWKGRDRIQLVLLKSEEMATEIVQKKIYNRSDTAMVMFWRNIQFNSVAKIPRKWNSSFEVKKVVSKRENSIGYIDADDVDDSVKILSVGGLLPGDEGYPLSQD